MMTSFFLFLTPKVSHSGRSPLLSAAERQYTEGVPKAGQANFFFGQKIIFIPTLTKFSANIWS
jgi:hypothetical protein